MSEDKTAEQNGAKTFEERVFMRFDSLEHRIEKLEMKQYDTKPMWEKALASIIETNERLRTFDERFDNIDQKFEALSTDLDNGLRGVERKIDVLNQYILDLRADQRYVDSRLEKIEAQAKPS